MIIENLRGQELFNEVYNDFLVISKDLKKRRQKERKPYIKFQRMIKDTIWLKYTMMSPKYNKWYIKSGIEGHYNKPKAINHFHIITNAGSGGSKLGIIYRGMKSTGKGYIVSVTSHVITRMKERNKNFANLSMDDLLESIFTFEEEGVFYDFEWKTQQQQTSSIPTSSQEAMILENGGGYKNKVSDDYIQIILKTSAGVFLGYSSKDRSEIRLITYITDFGENLEEVVNQFLIPAWICYNNSMFDGPYIQETYEKLMDYMKGKDDRNVYRLGE